MPHKPGKVKPLLVETARPPRPKREWYGWQHRRMRQVLLQTFPLCQLNYPGCEGWSVEAHHKVYPARCLEDYTACCKACHDELERETP